jgi:hypothetical protein
MSSSSIYDKYLSLLNASSSWTYDDKTKTTSIDQNFNRKLIGLPVDTEIIIFKNELEKFRSRFNQPICKKDLPLNIKRIDFGFSFNQLVDSLPESITHLSFGYNFNKSVDSLPPNITHLSFGFYFNKPVDSLPNSITHLIFGYYFDQPVDSLPNSITHLFFDCEFNKSVDNLPKSLISLSFNSLNYNHSIDMIPSQ